MSERDEFLTRYAKASGAFQHAVNVYMANKTDKHFEEVETLMNRLVNVEFSNVERFCNQHIHDKDIDSLLDIAKTDCEAMKKIFTRL